MNTYTTVEELLSYVPTTGKDTYGTFHIITGYEGTDSCFWCGTDLAGKRRRFCGGRSGCWTKYAHAFYWTDARSECLKLYDYRCANCGRDTKELYDQYARPHPRGLPWSYTCIEATMEVHHIIPLEARIRQSSPFNTQWNLICLCHVCHQELHLVLNAANRPQVLPAPTKFELAMDRGQLALAGLVEV